MAKVSKRSLILLVVLVVAVLPLIAVIQFLSDRYPEWMRAVASAVETRYAEYGERAVVCLADFTPFEWDRFYALGATPDLGEYPAVVALAWDEGGWHEFESMVNIVDSPAFVFAEGTEPVFYSYFPRFQKSRLMDNQEIDIAGVPADGLARHEAVFLVDLAEETAERRRYLLRPLPDPDRVPCGR